MKQELMNLIRRWLMEANEELDDGCNTQHMDEIPFSVESLDKAQMLIIHAIQLLGTEVNDEDNTGNR